METLIGVLVGIGLSAASGLRVFIPLLGPMPTNTPMRVSMRAPAG